MDAQTKAAVDQVLSLIAWRKTIGQSSMNIFDYLAPETADALRGLGYTVERRGDYSSQVSW